MMKSIAVATPSAWATSSYGGAPDTSPMELSALEEHLARCRGEGGNLFALGCIAERMSGFMAARLFTTLAVAGVLIGTVSLFS